MKLLALLFVLASPMAYSALDMKPGLWKVEMVIKANGKTMNPASEMQKAMAKMSPEQRKKMEAMMGEMKPATKDPGVSVCYSKAMLEKPESISSQDKKCDTKVVTNNPHKVVTNFKCEDGTHGVSTWSVKNQNAYDGLVNVTSPKGEKSQISYKANFMQSDCGKVKPAL